MFVVDITLSFMRDPFRQKAGKDTVNLTHMAVGDGWYDPPTQVIPKEMWYFYFTQVHGCECFCDHFRLWPRLTWPPPLDLLIPYNASGSRVSLFGSTHELVIRIAFDILGKPSVSTTIAYPWSNMGSSLRLSNPVPILRSTSSNVLMMSTCMMCVCFKIGTFPCWWGWVDWETKKRFNIPNFPSL